MERFLEQPRAWDLVQRNMRYLLTTIEEAYAQSKHDPWCECNDCVAWAESRRVHNLNVFACGREEAQRRITDPNWKNKPHAASCTCMPCRKNRRTVVRVRDPRVDALKVLGLDSTATTEEIKSRFRRIAREHHPDANPGISGHELEIRSAAFDAARKAYDLLMK